MSNPKISIVVPIYKVEKYLRRCVESILQQTYENLEIILVNDGSPDNCGKIAEQYSRDDIRVKVVHKQNGGLSDARNVGVNQVTGDYTMFVDSDDWLDLKMIKTMVDTVNRYQADIVQSAFYYAYEDHLLYDQRFYNKESPPYIFDNKSIMYELVINNSVKNFAWGKLYRTRLIKDIPFKKGVLFEDVFWAHLVIHKVHKFVLIHTPLYFYRQRNDSIIATYTTRNLDAIKGMKERHIFIENNYPELVNESYKAILKMSLIHYYLLFLKLNEEKGKYYRKEIHFYIKSHRNHLKKAVEDEGDLSRQLSLFLTHPLVNAGYLTVRKVIRRLFLFEDSTNFERIALNKKEEMRSAGL